MDRPAAPPTLPAAQPAIAARALDLWHVTELFTPHPAPALESSDSGRAGRRVADWIVARGHDDDLPWRRLDAHDHPGREWEHTLHLGVYSASDGYEIARHTLNPRAPRARGGAVSLAACATLRVDHGGRYVRNTAALATAAWCLGHLVERGADFVTETRARGLHDENAAAARIFTENIELLLADRAGGVGAAVTAADLIALHQLALNAARIDGVGALPTDRVRIASACRAADRGPGASETSLPDWMPGDPGEPGDPLQRWLGPETRRQSRIDLAANPLEVTQRTGAGRVPAGRWPGDPQQRPTAGVQTVVNEAHAGAGLVAVHRAARHGERALDVVRELAADALVARAREMSLWQRPEVGLAAARESLGSHGVLAVVPSAAAARDLIVGLNGADAAAPPWRDTVDYLRPQATALLAACGRAGREAETGGGSTDERPFEVVPMHFETAEEIIATAEREARVLDPNNPEVAAWNAMPTAPLVVQPRGGGGVEAGAVSTGGEATSEATSGATSGAAGEGGEAEGPEGGGVGGAAWALIAAPLPGPGAASRDTAGPGDMVGALATELDAWLASFASGKRQPGPWAEACASFRRAQERVDELLGDAAAATGRIGVVHRAEDKLAWIDRQLAAAEREVSSREERRAALKSEVLKSERTATAAKHKIDEQWASRPSWWNNVTSRGGARRDWDHGLSNDMMSAEAAVDAHQRLKKEAEGAGARIEAARAAVEDLRAQRTREANHVKSLRARLSRDTENYGDAYPGTLDRLRPGDPAPWLTEGLQRARAEATARALTLHRVFLENTAAALLESLSAARALLAGGAPGESAEAGGAGVSVAGSGVDGPGVDGPGEPTPEAAAAAWRLVSLIAPVQVALAESPGGFAAVGRGVVRVTVLDEAGQLSPAWAAGWLWRARTSVVMGDATRRSISRGMPVELRTELARALAVPTEWGEPGLTAQGLANRTSEIGTREASHGATRGANREANQRGAARRGAVPHGAPRRGAGLHHVDHGPRGGASNAAEVPEPTWVGVPLDD
ncbi:hypothetical protein JT358_15315 [Micrococcales bacterium 31B]|nr:hypothetical protein [Micrococcales bacterium 31B]